MYAASERESHGRKEGSRLGEKKIGVTQYVIKASDYGRYFGVKKTGRDVDCSADVRCT